MFRRLSTAPTSLKSSYHLKHLLILYWRPRYAKRGEHICPRNLTPLCSSVAVDRRLNIFDFPGNFSKSQHFTCIVQENYTGVILEYRNRFKTQVNFFVNKYLWKMYSPIPGSEIWSLKTTRPMLLKQKALHSCHSIVIHLVDTKQLKV